MEEALERVYTEIPEPPPLTEKSIVVEGDKIKVAENNNIRLTLSASADGSSPEDYFFVRSDDPLLTRAEEILEERTRVWKRTPWAETPPKPELGDAYRRAQVEAEQRKLDAFSKDLEAKKEARISEAMNNPPPPKPVADPFADVREEANKRLGRAKRPEAINTSTEQADQMILDDKGTIPGAKALTKEQESILKEITSVVDRGDLEDTIQAIRQGIKADLPDDQLNKLFRTMPAAELDRLGASRGFPNMSVYGQDPDQDTLLRMFRKLVGMDMAKPDPTNPKVAELHAKTIERVGRLLGGGSGVVTKQIALMRGNTDLLHKIGRDMAVGEILAMKASEEIKPLVLKMADDIDTVDTNSLREMVSKVRQVVGLLEEVRNNASAFGFNLMMRQQRLDPSKVKAGVKNPDVFRWGALDELDSLVTAGLTTGNKAKAANILK
jgi:hypothetical protein